MFSWHHAARHFMHEMAMEGPHSQTCATCSTSAGHTNSATCAHRLQRQQKRPNCRFVWGMAGTCTAWQKGMTFGLAA